MALTGEYAARVLRSAIGVILRDEGLYNEWSLARRVQDINQSPVAHTIQEFQGIARQALRIAAAGNDVLFGGPSAIPVRDLPVDPSIGPSDARALYRAVVSVTDQYGREVRTMATVASDVGLAYQDIFDRISEDLEGHSSNRRSVRAAIRSLSDTDQVSIIIVSAGRRR